MKWISVPVARRLWAALLLACCAAGATAQQTPPEGKAEADRQARQDATLETARVLLARLQRRQAELAKMEGEAPRQEPADRKAQVEAQAAARAEIAELQRNLETVVTGLDASALEPARGVDFDLTREIERLLQPLVRELNSITEEPRQVDRLRSEIDRLDQEEGTVRQAIERVDRLLAANDAAARPDVESYLRDERRRWQQRRTEVRNRKAVATSRLEDHMASRKSLLESAQTVAGGFFRSRGLNLLMALLAFVVVFVGGRMLFRPMQRLGQRKRSERSFYLRLAAVAFHIAIVVVAFIAALMVLYVAGDWVLLGLTLLFLVGLGWASKHTLPQFFEQIRLVLNLGAVRERERVYLDGLPWRVESLNLYARLGNPALTGGRLRLPIARLAGLRSRPDSSDEPWFPCRQGDWVVLSDGVEGEVVCQTPEMVQVVALGGARTTYRTADFLGLAPRTLSDGFRIAVTFGIDYQHQAICTAEPPDVMRRRLSQELGEAVGEGGLQALKVEFKEAAASSLDYAVLADFAGREARNQQALRRRIQRLLVDLCNEHGWVIPFQQVTIHQAPPA